MNNYSKNLAVVIAVVGTTAGFVFRPQLDASSQWWVWIIVVACIALPHAVSRVGLRLLFGSPHLRRLVVGKRAFVEGSWLYWTTPIDPTKKPSRRVGIMKHWFDGPDLDLIAQGHHLEGGNTGARIISRSDYATIDRKLSYWNKFSYGEVKGLAIGSFDFDQEEDECNIFAGVVITSEGQWNQQGFRLTPTECARLHKAFGPDWMSHAMIIGAGCDMKGWPGALNTYIEKEGASSA